MTKRTTIQVTREIFDRLQTWKTYRFDGRKGRVIQKHENAGKNAVGWSIGLPIVTVEWKD